jgi:hypothetical protein
LFDAMSRCLLAQTQFIPAPRAEVAAFFEDPRNLERITPPFLRFRIETPGEIPMQVGALIQYTIRLWGVPMAWTSRIDEYVPGERFVDLQLVGPYQSWRHLHTFEDAPGGTLVRDRVEYELPLGPLGSIAHVVFVRAQLRAIFRHRRRAVAELLGGAPEESAREPGPVFSRVDAQRAAAPQPSSTSAIV